MNIFLTTVPLKIKRVPILPLGLLYIFSELKKANNNVNLYDTNFDEEYERFLNDIKRVKPEFIGISMRYIDSCASWKKDFYYPSFVKFIKQVKDISPDSKVIVGGPGFSIFAEEIMRDMEDIAVGVRGPGEKIFLEIVENFESLSKIKGIYYRDANKRLIYTGPPEEVNLESITPPQIDEVYLKKYTKMDNQIGIESKRGCGFTCIYCTYPYIGGKLRLFPVGKVLETIEIFFKKGMRNFFFTDSIFNYPPEHAKEICRGLIERKWNLSWGAHFNEAFIDGELLDLAQRAGCKKLDFGLGGADDYSLKNLGKQTNIHQAFKVYDMVEKFKLDYSVSLFLYHPYINLKRYIKIFIVVLRLFRRGKISIFTNIRIYPHTPIAKYILRGNVSKGNESLLKPVYYDKYPYKIVNSCINLFEKIFPSFLKRKIRIF
jgi:radical SAM superfamily enzyme YgiQ (UPF0313 family)